MLRFFDTFAWKRRSFVRDSVPGLNPTCCVAICVLRHALIKTISSRQFCSVQQNKCDTMPFVIRSSAKQSKRIACDLSCPNRPQLSAMAVFCAKLVRTHARRRHSCSESPHSSRLFHRKSSHYWKKLTDVSEFAFLHKRAGFAGLLCT